MIKDGVTVEYCPCNAAQLSALFIAFAGSQLVRDAPLLFPLPTFITHSGTDTLLKLQKCLIMSSIIGVMYSGLELSRSILNCFRPPRHRAPPGKQQFRAEPRLHQSA